MWTKNTLKWALFSICVSCAALMLLHRSTNITILVWLTETEFLPGQCTCAGNCKCLHTAWSFVAQWLLMHWGVRGVSYRRPSLLMKQNKVETPNQNWTALLQNCHQLCSTHNTELNHKSGWCSTCENGSLQQRPNHDLICSQSYSTQVSLKYLACLV